MKRAPLLTAVVALLLPAISFAQRSDAGGWTNLFNVRDLSGWKTGGPTGVFHTANGEIIARPAKPDSASCLFSDKPYRDFILELDVVADTVARAAILFSCAAPGSDIHQGYRLDINPSFWEGGIRDQGERGWLYTPGLNSATRVPFRDADWNHFRIECIGHTIRTWVNGTPFANLVDSLTLKGRIALQVAPAKNENGQQGIVRWKNLRIRTRDLQPSPPDTISVVNLRPNNVSTQEKSQGFRLLWDGKTTAGWRGAYKTAFPSKGWRISDGVLSVEKSAASAESTNGGDIVTKEQFSSFELKFDFRLTEGANSGVKYFVTEKENNTGSAIGLEYQILDDDRHPDAKLGVDGDRTLASLYDLIPSKKIPGSRRPVGAWNQGVIRVYPNNHVEYWLNGFRVLDYQRGSPEYLALVAKSKYKIWKDFGMAAKGHILLQDHGDAVSFRSIKIREW